MITKNSCKFDIVTEDERCNSLSMVDDNLIMKNEMVDNENFENQGMISLNIYKL